MNITAKETIIGSANLEYDSNGNLLTASFSPTVKVTHEDIRKELGNCKGKTEEEVINCAQLLLASFFSKVSNIELRDIEKTTLETRIVKSKKHESGEIGDIEIKFIYKEKV